MMPDACASMRSIARWVFPVLVGPRTAFTWWPNRGVANPDMRGWLYVAARKASETGWRPHEHVEIMDKPPDMPRRNGGLDDGGRHDDHGEARVRSRGRPPARSG